jgi:hypothetical protein
MTPESQRLRPIDYDWLVTEVDPHGIVRVNFSPTGHFIILAPDLINHFEYQPHRDWNGLKHGLFVLQHPTRALRVGRLVPTPSTIGPSKRTPRRRRATRLTDSVLTGYARVLPPGGKQFMALSPGPARFSESGDAPSMPAVHRASQSHPLGEPSEVG